jgi:hypothetical protein
VVNGSLEVGVEVDVATAGRFHVEATLYGDDGSRMVAWAQAARALEPGRQWIPLQFYARSFATGTSQGHISSAGWRSRRRRKCRTRRIV